MLSLVRGVIFWSSLAASARCLPAAARAFPRVRHVSGLLLLDRHDLVAVLLLGQRVPSSAGGCPGLVVHGPDPGGKDGRRSDRSGPRQVGRRHVRAARCASRPLRRTTSSERRRRRACLIAAVPIDDRSADTVCPRSTTSALCHRGSLAGQVDRCQGHRDAMTVWMEILSRLRTARCRWRAPLARTSSRSRMLALAAAPRGC